MIGGVIGNIADVLLCCGIGDTGGACLGGGSVVGGVIENIAADDRVLDLIGSHLSGDI